MGDEKLTVVSQHHFHLLTRVDKGNTAVYLYTSPKGYYTTANVAYGTSMGKTKNWAMSEVRSGPFR